MIALPDSLVQRVFVALYSAGTLEEQELAQEIWKATHQISSDNPPVRVTTNNLLTVKELAPEVPMKGHPRRHMSKSARTRIAEAQKRRWEAYRVAKAKEERRNSKREKTR